MKTVHAQRGRSNQQLSFHEVFDAPEIRLGWPARRIRNRWGLSAPHAAAVAGIIGWAGGAE